MADYSNTLPPFFSLSRSFIPFFQFSAATRLRPFGELRRGVLSFTIGGGEEEET